MMIFQQVDLAKNFLATGVLVLGLVLCRFLILRALRTNEGLSRETRRLWIGRVGAVLMIILVLGVSFIWAEQLRAFALSLVAVAAAVVIGTKELILCFLGGLLKSFSQPFKIGDRIEINNVRGDVLRHDLFTTTLLEIGPGKQAHQFTGKEIVFPNSLFLSFPLVNESSEAKFRLHSFTISFSNTHRVNELRTLILDAAQSVCSEFIQEAQRTFDQMSESDDVDPPNANPKLAFSFPAPDRIDVVLRVPVPARQSGKIEQNIIGILIDKSPGIFLKAAKE